MKRQILAVGVVAMLLIVNSDAADEAEDKAIAIIESLGGFVHGDGEKVTTPVTSVSWMKRIQISPGAKVFQDEHLRVLAAFKQLQFLHLSSSAVTDAGLKELARLPKLSFLHLDDVAVTDAGLKHLAVVKSLRSLSLYGTQVTDAGMKDLATLTGLSHLDLSNTGITDAGLKDLMKMRRLWSIDLRNTKVTDAGIEEFRKALPACRVNSDFSKTRGVSPNGPLPVPPLPPGLT